MTPTRDELLAAAHARKLADWVDEWVVTTEPEMAERVVDALHEYAALLERCAEMVPQVPQPQRKESREVL